MLRAVACVVATGLALAACGGHDKAGGAQSADGKTIQIATRDGSPGILMPYAAAVERLAPGTRVDVRPEWRADEEDPEGATVADVREGRLPFAVSFRARVRRARSQRFRPVRRPVRDRFP